jgi:methylmalonyl-CoA mutase C-terminal domain/subunit
MLLFGGGVIPPDDAAALEAQGIGKIFPPGSSIPEIVDYLNRVLSERQSKKEEGKGSDSGPG